jgi:hypothetical protein
MHISILILSFRFLRPPLYIHLNIKEMPIYPWVLRGRVCNRNLKQNVFLHFAYTSTVYTVHFVFVSKVYQSVRSTNFSGSKNIEMMFVDFL